MNLDNNSNTNFFIILLLILGLTYYCYYYQDNNENWINYKNLSYGNWETAQTPDNYYRRDEYRKPYRWPVCINVDYPVPHCRHL